MDVFELEDDADLLYEEDVIRTPYEVKPWVRYLEHKANSSQKNRNLLYERALSFIPGSYKIWLPYLQERVHAVKGLCIDHPAYGHVNNVFERALVFMHKMPRIWQEYLKFLTIQHFTTKTRKAFDRALQSLPITQHNKIWPLYLNFVKLTKIDELTARVYRRYLKLEPDDIEEYVELLVQMGKFGEAAERLAGALNDESFISKKKKSRHDLWMDLCSIISKHPDQVTNLKVEEIIRQGLSKYTSEVGRLWVALADFFIRGAHFEKARDIFQEGIMTVVTVRDFSLIFDAYTKFEESLITAKMEQMDDEDEENKSENENENENENSVSKSYKDDLKLFDEDIDDTDIRLMRLETLMQRRTELLNSVVLRQNPHNVYEWHKRIKIFEHDPKLVVITYSEAVKTVNPKKAKGKPHSLWIAFAKFYESHNSLENARKTFDTAVKANFRGVDDLGTVWCEYAEMELRHKEYGKALELMKRATAGWRKFINTNQYDENVPVQQRVHRSVKLWSFYADLQESLGTVEEAKEVYDQMIQLKVVTPQHIINYATLLEENKFFEDSYRAFEKGISLFSYPHVKDIWIAYLTKFVNRFGGKKIERARDLFEQAVSNVPAEQAKDLFLLYARLEEEYGLARHAMSIYERATKAVDNSSKFEVFEIYIARAAQAFGVTRTREIYEKAIESIPDALVKDMCVRYAALERKLGEIDRARAIYIHMAQYCDPRLTPDYWKIWNDFEVAHGNEETFKDMLRIRRNVQAQYTQSNFMTKGMFLNARPNTESDSDHRRRAGGNLVDEMKELEQHATILSQKAGISSQILDIENENSSNNKTVKFTSDHPTPAELQGLITQSKLTNPDEIVLRDDDLDEEIEKPKTSKVLIEQKSIPDAVFGSVKAQFEQEQQQQQQQQQQGQQQQGALARFQKQKP